jgi:CBS domain-containing protein
MKSLKEFASKPIGDLYHSVEVVSTSPDTPVGEVVELMATRNIGCVVVTQNNEPVGIFTERDVLKKIACKGQDLYVKPISDFMTHKPVSVLLSTPMAKIMTAMRLGRFRHLVFKDEDGKLVGVISIKDVTSLMIDFMTEHDCLRP